MTIKLAQEWTIWYDKPNIDVKTENWDQFLIEIASFSTINNFWGIFNNLTAFSELIPGGSYHIFKKGILPKWEDIKNIDGGKWVLSIRLLDKLGINELWEKILCFLIGGGFGKKNTYKISGIVGSNKNGQVKFSIWIQDSKNDHYQLLIGEKWKNFLINEKMTKSFTLDYYPHKYASLTKKFEN